jgi:hypothetical protein
MALTGSHKKSIFPREFVLKNKMLCRKFCVCTQNILPIQKYWHHIIIIIIVIVSPSGTEMQSELTK